MRFLNVTYRFQFLIDDHHDQGNNWSNFRCKRINSFFQILNHSLLLKGLQKYDLFAKSWVKSLNNKWTTESYDQYINSVKYDMH